MFEVKYPNSHNYDGKRHMIKIDSIEYIDGHLLVYGKSYDIPNLIIEIKYSDEVSDWVMIPKSMKEIVEIIKNNKGNSINLTDFMFKELDGRRITNQNELNYVFPKNDIFKDDSYEILQKFIKDAKTISIADIFQNSFQSIYYKYHGSIDEEKLLKDTIKDFFQRIPEELPINIEEVFSINKKRAYKLIGDFLDNNKNYLDRNKEEIIVKYIEDVFQILLEISDNLFMEDDLIDLGNILAKLNDDRVNKYDNEEFNEIINLCYEYIDTLKEKFFKK